MKKVAVCGSFDGIHEGHKYFFSEAKKKGDLLYVYVVPDQIIINVKGHPPLHTQLERVELVSKLDCVDYAIPNPFDPDHVIDLIAKLSPEVYCFGHDQKRQTGWNQKLKDKLRRCNPHIEIYTIGAYQRHIYSSTRLNKFSPE